MKTMMKMMLVLSITLLAACTKPTITNTHASEQVKACNDANGKYEVFENNDGSIAGVRCTYPEAAAEEQAIKDALIDDELDGIGLPPNTAVGGTEHERRREERKREALKYKYVAQEDLFRFAAECADRRRHPEPSVLDLDVEMRDNSPPRITAMRCTPIRVYEGK